MSIWTHVVGSIRVDGIPNISGSVDAIKETLGKICTFEKWEESTTLPCGSEGGLQYKVIEYDTGLPWITIPIWGDLRDYDDVEAIKKWWFETLEKLGCIRDAVIHISVEGKESIVLTADE